MASAGALEELMILLLLKAEVFRLGKRVDAQTTAADQARMLEKWQKERFNGLMHLCWRNFELSSELKDAMEIAKASRDHLAHQFWRGHGANIWTEEGVEIIAADCAHSANHFRNVSDTLISETGINPSDYIEMKKASGINGEHNAGWHQLVYALDDPVPTA